MGEIAFEVEHVAIIEGRVAQENAPKQGLAEIVLASGDAYTYVHGERIVASYGFLPIWPGRSTMWGIGVQDIALPELLALARHVKAKLSGRTEYRIEAHARDGWEPAHHWLRTLGFKKEAHFPSFWGIGRGATQYCIVKE